MARSFLRRHATTIVLTALATAGAVVVLVADRGSVTTAEAEARKRNLFEAWRPDEITELTVTSGGRAARLTRGAPDKDDQAPWQVVIDGQTYPADEQSVDQYLGTLEFAVFERRVPAESVDRAAFKLDAPRASADLTMSGRRMRLALGARAPSPEGAVYAEVEGRGVFVITAQLTAALDVKPETFRSRRLIPYASVDLEGLRLDGAGGARHFVRAPWGSDRGAGFRFDGSTRSTPEGRARVSAAALDKVLTAFGSLQAESFLSDDEARSATASAPGGWVTLTLVPRDRGQTPAVLDLGGACPGRDDHAVAIRREPTRVQACVPKALVETLSMPVEAFLDKKLIAAPLDTITEIKLVAGDKTLELARTGTKWHLRAPADRELDADIGRGFAESLLAVEASAFTSGEAPGLTPPQATARILSTAPTPLLDGGGDEERVEALEIGAPQGGLVHVRRLEDGAILTVPTERAAVFFPSDLALRPREVIDEPLKRFRSLRIDDGPRTQRLRRTEEGAWELLEPSGGGLSADVDLASDVAELFGSLKAERWVAAKDDGSFGLDKPRMVIEAEVTSADDQAPDASDAPRTLRLALGAPTTDGSFARLSGDDAVFVAPRSLESAAGRWLLDRTALVVEPAEVQRVTLAPAGGAEVVVENAGGVWKLAGADKGGTQGKQAPGGPGGVAQAPADATLGATRAAAVRDVLGDLLAEGAVSVGKPEAHQGFEKPALTLTILRTPGEGGGGGGKLIRILFGAGDAWRGTTIYYARRDGIDATFAVAQSKVRPLLEAAGAR